MTKTSTSLTEEVASTLEGVMAGSPDREELADLLARHKDKDVKKIARRFAAWWAKKGDGAALTLTPFANWLSKEAPLRARPASEWPQIEAALRRTWGRAYALVDDKPVFLTPEELDEALEAERQRLEGCTP